MKPLSGITVVDMTSNLPGPYCSMILSDLGAGVTKVEPPTGDPLRTISPGMWSGLNRGKRSLTLDLKTEDGRALLGKLASSADVVLEGWRPGVAARLGADYGTLSARNPGLVYCAISGFGQNGPWRDRPGHDINYLALSGYLALQTRVEGRPYAPPVLVSDLAAGMYASTMVLAALTGRRQTGNGSYVDLSMTEAALALLGMEIARSTDNGGAAVEPNVTFIPHYGVFRCSDGRWFSLGIVHEDHFWDRFCEAAGLNDLVGVKYEERVAQGDRLRDRLDTAFSTLPSEEWDRRLREADVPAAPVLEVDDVLDVPQFVDRGVVREVDGQRLVGQPATFSTGSVAPSSGAPPLGRHNEEVLRELGYTPSEFERFEAAGVFGRAQEQTVP